MVKIFSSLLLMSPGINPPFLPGSPLSNPPGLWFWASESGVIHCDCPQGANLSKTLAFVLSFRGNNGRKLDTYYLLERPVLFCGTDKELKEKADHKKWIHIHATFTCYHHLSSIKVSWYTEKQTELALGIPACTSLWASTHHTSGQALYTLFWFVCLISQSEQTNTCHFLLKE